MKILKFNTLDRKTKTCKEMRKKDANKDATLVQGQFSLNKPTK